MLPGDGAVLLTVQRGNTLVFHRDIIAHKSLPNVLKNLLIQQVPPENGIYKLSYPIAKQLSQELTLHASDTLKVNTESIDRLNVIPCPNNFQVRWLYNKSQQQLIRSFNDAKGFLGEGWFYSESSIWQVTPKFPESLLDWFNKPNIISKDIVRFCTLIYPQLDNARYVCELDIESSFDANLIIVKILKQSIDVQITNNNPTLASHLQPISGDTDNLISGTTILPGWRKKFRGKLLALARSGDVQRIQGNDLLTFIQDDVIPIGDSLGVDIPTLKSAYRILDAHQCPTRWKLEHNMVHGIGCYHSVPCLDIDAQLIPLEQIGRKIESGVRFYRLENGWLEFTPSFKSRYSSWKQKGISSIRLLSQEIMGSHLDRLDKLKLRPPLIRVEKADTESEQARRLIETMRIHGLPCGFSGLQQDTSSILTEACKRLLSEDNSVKILWLLPRRKLNEVVTVLKKARVPYSNNFSRQQGHVLITSPDTQIPDIQWNLVIFTDIDTIASGERQSRAYSALRRTWSISTFSREDWHRDVLRSQRILTALGLSKDDLTTFIQLCVGKYTQQTDGLLSRLTSPFKRMILGSDSQADQSTGIPIPPRNEQSTPRPLKNTDNVYRPSFTVSVNVSTTKNRFLDQAQHFAKNVESQVEPVPFMQYWPTYESMTQAQRRWYFYWRSQVRLGNYIPSDLSYLFIHIYEIIHLVGFDSAQNGYNYLVAFWENYRVLHPKLDNYLVDWIADFIVVHKLPQEPLKWYAHATTIAGRLTNESLAVEAWLSTSRSFSQIPEVLLNSICDYRYTKSKFYQQHNSQEIIETELRRGLDAIDAFVYQQHGKSLLEYYRPTEINEVQRQPFAGAVYEGSRELITVANVPNWGQTDELQRNITSILKYTENRLRRQHNFKGTLRGIELPTEWVGVIDVAFPTAEKTILGIPSEQKTSTVFEPLEIDFDRIESLTVESDAIRDRLQVEDKDVSNSTSSTVIPTDVHPVFELQPVNLNTNRPEDTPEHLLTELEEVADILTGDTSSIQLLQHLMDSDWETNEDDAQVILGDEFLNVVVDRLNERSIELLGDQLIFIEGARLIVTEDFRDEIDHLLSNPDEMISPIDNTIAVQYDDLETEWAEFVVQMRSYHWEALNALLLGEDIPARLDGIARSAYTTIDLLIDEINEVALSSIGDIVIEVGDEPQIEDEDVESLRSLMTWAFKNVKMEF